MNEFLHKATDFLSVIRNSANLLIRGRPFDLAARAFTDF